jgi:hypothetical protein
VRVITSNPYTNSWFVNLSAPSNAGDFAYVEQVTPASGTTITYYTPVGGFLNVTSNAQISMVWSNSTWYCSVYQAGTIQNIY